MFGRRSCALWLLQAILLSILFSVAQFATPTTTPQTPTKHVRPAPTDEEDPRKKVDENVTYIIVAIALMFLFTVTAVIIVSLHQTRLPVRRRAPRPKPTSQSPQRTTSIEEPQPQSMNPQSSRSNAYVISNRPVSAVSATANRPVSAVSATANRPVSAVSATANRPVSAVSATANRPVSSHSATGPYEVQGHGAYEELDPWWEIPPDNLKICGKDVLGSGQFGVIYLGDVTTEQYGVIKCAVKTLKREASEAERQSLKIELQNMSNMDPHPNIVNFIGAQTRDGLFNVVVEYCANGDLFNYVKSRRSDLSWLGQKESGSSIDYVTRLRIAFDVANGMSYLSTKGFIHRDLAARNVLLDGQIRAKVSDFGRSRDVGDTYKIFHSVRRNEPIPTRWMPVETLRHQIFTTKSDVWSFGVLLWEIESGAIRPYNDLNTYRQVVDKVVYDGYRLEQPSYCPDVLYQIMTECWKIDPEERPTFNEIAQNFSNLLKAHLSVPPQYSTQ